MQSVEETCTLGLVRCSPLLSYPACFLPWSQTEGKMLGAVVCLLCLATVILSSTVLYPQGSTAQV